MNKEHFIREYTKAIKNRTAAIFAGAGLSKSAGYVDWVRLLKDVAEEIGLDSTKEQGNLPALAQYYENEKNNRNLLSQLICNEFCDIQTPDKNHRLLAHLPIHTYWTTNYDHLIEDCLHAEKKKTDVKVSDENISVNLYGSDAVVYKMHGDVNNPNQTVLTLREYETYAECHPLMLNALKFDLQNKTFLFLGFSFTDPNFNHILSQLRVVAHRNKASMKTHYCIMRNPQRMAEEKEEDFEYRKKKEELFYKDLSNYGIEMVMVEEFSDITDIISDLNKSYFRNTIYLSGAVYDYGKWTKENAEKFVFNLSSALIREGYRIVTGYGLGIGNYVIGGVLNEVYMNKNKQLEEELIVRPFPQGEDMKENWSAYRKNMISYAGISIFMFGNKKDEKGIIVPSDGMQQEYDISEAQGNVLIPIASTEYISRTLWDQLMLKHGEEEPYKSLKDDFIAISDVNLCNNYDKLINLVIELVKKISK